MTPITHIASGVALALVLDKVGFISLPLFAQSNGILDLVLVALVSLLPDINILWSPINKHHSDFSHYPVFWLIVGIGVGSASYLVLGSFELGVLFTALVLLHLVLDTVGFSLGVHWLAPFNKREFSFTNITKTALDLSFKEKGRMYLRYTAFRVELVVFVVSIGLIVLLR